MVRGSKTDRVICVQGAQRVSRTILYEITDPHCKNMAVQLVPPIDRPRFQLVKTARTVRSGLGGLIRVAVRSQASKASLRYRAIPSSSHVQVERGYRWSNAAREGESLHSTTG